MLNETRLIHCFLDWICNLNHEGWTVYTLQVRADWVGWQLIIQHWVMVNRPRCVVVTCPNNI